MNRVAAAVCIAATAAETTASFALSQALCPESSQSVVPYGPDYQSDRK
jgi:hypothetical protein